MNETLHPAPASTAPWPNGDHAAHGADSATWNGEDTLPSGNRLLNQAAQGAHDTIDRVADRVKPIARQLGEQVSAAEDDLQARSTQLRKTKDEWMESARSKVRSNPLVSVAAATALGLLIARLTR
jgi:ElaB/YqjD/DUF883 family membrane-anchored ribosome-binding protein